MGGKEVGVVGGVGHRGEEGIRGEKRGTTVSFSVHGGAHESDPTKVQVEKKLYREKQ